MTEYDVTLLDNLVINLKRGRNTKARRMVMMLVSRCKTPVELFQIVRRVDYEMDKFITWGIAHDPYVQLGLKIKGIEDGQGQD